MLTQGELTDIVTVILFCMLAFIMYVVITDTDTPHGVSAAATSEEEPRYITPGMGALICRLGRHKRYTDDQGRVLVMVDTPSGKYYSARRRLEDRSQPMTQALPKC